MLGLAKSDKKTVTSVPAQGNEMPREINIPREINMPREEICLRQKKRKIMILSQKNTVPALILY